MRVFEFQIITLYTFIYYKVGYILSNYANIKDKDTPNNKTVKIKIMTKMRK